jgi:hypothetical protein
MLLDGSGRPTFTKVLAKMVLHSPYVTVIAGGGGAVGGGGVFAMAALLTGGHTTHW